MQLNKKLITLCSALLLGACSSQPPVVYSSQPLVNHVEAKSNLVSSQYWTLLDSLSIGDTQIINQQNVIVEAKYLSALGEQCIMLRIPSEIIDKRVVCKMSNEEWKLVPNIVVSNKNSDLFEGDVSNAL